MGVICWQTGLTIQVQTNISILRDSCRSLSSSDAQVRQEGFFGINCPLWSGWRLSMVAILPALVRSSCSRRIHDDVFTLVSFVRLRMKKVQSSAGFITSAFLKINTSSLKYRNIEICCRERLLLFDPHISRNVSNFNKISWKPYLCSLVIDLAYC